MDLDQLQRRLVLYALLCALGLVVVQVGEHLGWWNDLGEVATQLLTAGTVLLAVLAFLLSATKGQVRMVVAGVGQTNGMLVTLGDEVRRQGEELRRHGEELRRHGEEQRRQGEEQRRQGEEQRRQGQEQRNQTVTQARMLHVLEDIRDRL